MARWNRGASGCRGQHGVATACGQHVVGRGTDMDGHGPCATGAPATSLLPTGHDTQIAAATLMQAAQVGAWTSQDGLGGTQLQQVELELGAVANATTGLSSTSAVARIRFSYVGIAEVSCAT